MEIHLRLNPRISCLWITPGQTRGAVGRGSARGVVRGGQALADVVVEAAGECQRFGVVRGVDEDDRRAAFA
jgi:hypothetical protein